MKRWIALFSSVFLIGVTHVARADSSVVGVSERHHFGEWDWGSEVPRISVGLGVGVGAMTLHDTTLTGGTKAAPTNGPSGAIDGTRVTTTMFEIRPRFFLGGPVYFGPSIGIGPAFVTRAVTTEGASVSGNGFAAQLGGVLGLRARPGRGPLSIALETIVAARLATFTVQTGDQYWSASSSTFVLQPRLQVDAWTSAWASIGVFGGVDAVGDHNVTAGLAVTFHIAPFDENPP